MRSRGVTIALGLLCLVVLAPVVLDVPSASACAIPQRTCPDGGISVRFCDGSGGHEVCVYDT